ncbi:MAG: aldo/keto reductase [Deltaproteobacteria bacterium]|nr:aldo/keto reductase [Deltaproteobacteria bacterium]
MKTLDVQGVAVPSFLYGTAWKEDRTAELVTLALEAGFRGIDTANQRKHYFEAGVGEALGKSGIPRAELFLQSKFTYQRGQDDRLPYDPDASLTEQVRQSFESSLEHLGTDYLDSLVLHGPTHVQGWSDEDREAWAAMEALGADGRVKLLGVSNVSPSNLEGLLADHRVVPAFVQNRCYARTGWDQHVRKMCRDSDIVYQGFSLLTANREQLARPAITELAGAHDATVPQVVFRAMQQIGMLPLTGTSDPAHMRQDLECSSIQLSKDQLGVILNVGP